MTIQIVLFLTLAITSLILALIAFRRVHARRYYRTIPSLRFLLPTVCIISSLESANFAFSGHFKKLISDKSIFRTIYILTALKVPMLLVIIFELTYLVHNRRCVNFCGIQFEESRRIRRNEKKNLPPLKSFLARNMIRALGLCLLALDFFLNFGILDGLLNAENELGITGWYFVWDTRDKWKKQKSLILLNLLPTTIFSFTSCYLTITLWRYGTESAMVVHSSCINPWFYPLLGTISAFCGQLCPIGWYPFTSNAGFIFLTGSILHLMSHIDKDIYATSELNEFLDQISTKGYMITIMNESSIKEHNFRIIAADDEVT